MKIKLLKDFKEFALKGNMIDIAIGVIIGAAFNKVIDVLVKEIFLPPLSLLTAGVNLEDKRLVLREAVIENGNVKFDAIVMGYGKFIETGIDFMIIGFTVFFIVKVMNKIKRKAEDPTNTTEVTPKDIELLNKIVELTEKQVSLLEQTKK